MNRLPAHFMVSEIDGGLWDTRKPEWSKGSPVRTDYQRTFTEIDNSLQLRATLRNGSYAWPGGYPLVFICADDECLSFDAVQSDYSRYARDIRDSSFDRIVGCFIHYEGAPIECAASGQMIESAYGDSDVKESAE